MRAGTGAELPIVDGAVQLSIRDAILLALENNLDIESAQLLRPIAFSDLQRARSGQLLRNVPTAISAGPGSTTGSLPGAGPAGYEGPNGQAGVLSGVSIQLAGSEIPNIEPVLFATGGYAYRNDPLANNVFTGTNSLETHGSTWGVGIRKGFFTGTDVIAKFDTVRLNQNAPNNSINPSITASSSLRIQQHLLQGFGVETNMRAIRIARNNSKISELVFKQQVTVTVSEVLTLYYDLVAYREQLAVMRQALKMADLLLATNEKRVDVGQAVEADVAESQRLVDGEELALHDAEVQIREQELTLKSVLTRKGLEDPRVLAAEIIPTDSFDSLSAPQLRDTVENIADRAIRQRDEMGVADIGLLNKQFSLSGTRGALRPILDVYLSLQHNGLAGSLNSTAPPGVQQETDPALIGGFGTVLSQLVHAHFPSYEAGFQLSIPLTNRAAMADLERDEVEQHQQEVAVQKLRTSIRLQAIKSALAYEQARTQYLASVKLRSQQETAYKSEQKMFDLGTSSAGRLNDSLNQLHLSQIRAVIASNTLARAKVNLDAALNETIDRNLIVIDTPHFRAATAAGNTSMATFPAVGEKEH
jgi:outer membrane protein TolC